jgi:Protein of unknown function (DUF2730)
MTFSGLDWGEIATVIGIFITAGGGAYWVLHARLARDFAAKQEVAKIDGRLGEVEGKLNSIPTHADLQRVADRVGAVESRMSGLQSELTALRDLMTISTRHTSETMSRIERQLTVLLQHELAKEKGL